MIARLCLIAVLASTLSAVVVGQKPVKERRSSIDTSPPPQTLTEMARLADAIVVARATGKNSLRNLPESYGLETTHELQIEEVLKFSPAVPTIGELLYLDMAGGTKEYADHIRRDVISDYEEIRRNRRYLIFIRWKTFQGTDRLAPIWPAAGIFDVTDPRVRSLDRSFRRHNGRDNGAFMAEARKAAKG